jgi:hypothetical protein
VKPAYNGILHDPSKLSKLSVIAVSSKQQHHVIANGGEVELKLHYTEVWSALCFNHMSDTTVNQQQDWLQNSYGHGDRKITPCP